MRIFTRALMLTILALTFAIPSYALTYYFNTANTIGTWSGDPTIGYGSVEITKTTEDWVKFEIKANENYFLTDPSENSGLTWDRFSFNFNSDKTLETDSIIIDSDDGRWRVIEDRNISSFGIFDFTEKGRRLPSMLNPLEFTIQDKNLDILDFVFPNLDGNYFAGHLRRFGDDNEESIQLAVAPVPEPATLILIGSGLGGILLYRRRTAG